jgi:hypothetical protein
VLRLGARRVPGTGPVRPGCAPDARCWPGVTGLCTGWSDAGSGGADFALAGHDFSALNDYFSSRTINTPSPTLERIRLPFKSYPCLHSLSPPLKSIQSLRISHSTHSNPNLFGRKIEETPIYVSTKPNFIPPCVHRVMFVTLGFVGNPRRLGSPGGIRLVIRPMESL